MPGFKRGAEAAAEAAKAQQAGFNRAAFFGIKDGESIVVRFLTDGDAWVVVDMHGNVPTKAKPAGYTGNWPERMGAVCRYTKLDDGSTIADDCYICDNMTETRKKKNSEEREQIPFGKSARPWALACVREEVRNETGTEILGYRDQEREVQKEDDKGNKTVEKVKDVVMINMGYKNFFSALEGFFAVYHTLLDRDYRITRKGAGTDTDYDIVPLDPSTMADGRRFDLREPDLMERYTPFMPDLVAEVEQRASNAFYGRFFDPNVVVTSEESGNGAQTTKPSTEVANQADLKSLRERVMGYSPGATDQQPSADAPPNGGTPTPEPAAPPAPAPAASGPVAFD